MLDAMRSNARSSLIIILFGAIIVTFIFSFGRGSSGFRTRTPETWAAKVNGETIPFNDLQQAYARRFKQMGETRGGKYTVEQAKADNLKKDALKSLIDQELLAQQGDELGIRVSDDEVADAVTRSPQFQQEGKFDFDYYQRLVQNGYGMSVPRFEEGLRKDLIRGKVVESIINAAVVSDEEVKAFYVAQNESAKITFVKFTGFMFRDQAKATDAEAEGYARSHAKEIAEQYEKEKKTRFTQGQAVRVRAITALLKPGADEKAARARIDAALAEVKAGKDFAAVAKEKSEDSTTKDKGGDLGFVSLGGSAYGKSLEEQALKLKIGETSAVFKDRTGFHVLRAEESRPERVQALAEVQKQIAQEKMASQKALELARKKAQETIAQLQGGKELKELFPVKKQEPGKFDFSSFMKPQATEAEKFHPMGGYVPGVGLAPKLSAAVFAVQEAGGVSAAPVEEGDAVYVFKVAERARADLAKLTADETGKVRDRLENQRKNELYASYVERLRKRSRIVENDRALSYETVAYESYNPADDF